MKNEKEKTVSVMIKCRVLPNNRYGFDGPGTVLEVSEKDYKLARHCLISFDDEKKLAAAAAAIPSKTESARKEMEGYRDMFRAQHEQRKKLEADRAARESLSAQEHAKKLQE